ncbi:MULTISPECIES: hypothetical protein [unclassified Gordonia (in: high G+C Gram-positive bacteria)]|uniref:hypothetical protein n=1 Tax=unclassified Gordonia (in: high G+C Gram-positive bacteria) TaxID=2657482 RepID=UPI001117AC7A|nr:MULTISPECIES: hypothetical protein [unclassified Gordonia (in: high G+C Gram-positive bacteria)]MCX2753682.1 hypothetical protein [Gordonia sp. 4N]
MADADRLDARTRQKGTVMLLPTGLTAGSTTLRAVLACGLCLLLLVGCARQPGGVTAELSHSSGDVVSSVASGEEGLRLWAEDRAPRQYVRVLFDDLIEQSLSAFGAVVNLDIDNVADEPMRAGVEDAMGEATRVLVAARSVTLLDREDPRVAESLDALTKVGERLQRIVDDPRSAAGGRG